MKPIKRVLLVCTGNSCRSIMAEGYLKKRLKDIGVNHIKVESAGTGTVSGLTPTEEAIEVMKEMDIDVSEHKSTTLDENLIKNSDLILVMEPLHKDRIFEMVPEAAGKTYYLREFAKASVKENIIPDPIGRHVDFYRTCLNMIKESIEGFIEWLRE